MRDNNILDGSVDKGQKKASNANPVKENRSMSAHKTPRTTKIIIVKGSGKGSQVPPLQVKVHDVHFARPEESPLNPSLLRMGVLNIAQAAQSLRHLKLAH
jgi:hypothetical protein